VPSDLIGERDELPPRAVLDDWLRKVGPSIEDPTMPRYWIWNGVQNYNSYSDYVDD
jgi:hypothetical protein